MDTPILKGIRSMIVNLLKSPTKTISKPPEESKSSSAPSSINTKIPDFDEQPSMTKSFLGSVSEGSETILIQRIPVTISKSHTEALKLTSEISSCHLWEAALLNRPSECKTLLKGSLTSPVVSPNDKFGKDERSALHLSSLEGYLEVCEHILDYGINTDLNLTDINGMTPLHLAAMNGHLTVVELLVRSGAELNSKDYELNTPLHLASKAGHKQVVHWLLTKTPNVNIINKEGRTPEMCSSVPEIVKLYEAFFKKHERKLTVSPVKVPTRVSIKQLVASDNRRSIGKVTSNDFAIISGIGKGSFGEVFLVRKTDSNKLFAMKVLKKEKIVSENLIRYAMTERNVLSYMKHPFIVSLNYAFQTSEKLFLILDYCPGRDLAFHLRKQKKFPEWQAKIYICEIVLALEELHKRNIIFRDLKPDNVVLDEYGHAMLTDFGLSKEEVSDKTITKSFCGSVAYLAPEIIKRRGHGKSVDWYLLGVLLYEMIVGIPPYFSTNRNELFRNIECGHLKVPSSVSFEVKSFLKGLLQRDPEKRLGANGDASEVKRHPYFREIEWSKVLNRELEPPVPSVEPLDLTKTIRSEVVFGSLGPSDQNNEVNGWTFVSEM